MEPITTIMAILVISYLVGSIPFGWIIVKLATGRDVRGIESGRTGGTNVMRAAGVAAGAITAILDVVKGAAVVWLAREMLDPNLPYREWVIIAAPLAAILGHNYSIYLLERHVSTGKMRLRGGAGGATCLGGAVGLWFPALFIILPLALIVYLVVGYASVTTLSIAFFAMVIFLVRAIQGLSPWQYALYGLLSLIMLIWALRPNIQRLREGNERIHGLRVWLRKRANRKTEQQS